MSDAEKPVNLTVGALGEQAASEWYAQNGYTVVGRNVREGRRELDLIVEDADGIAFVEVKTRTQTPGVRSRFGRPADAVDKAKRERTVLAAQAYLRAHPTGKQPRIDVAEVYVKRTPEGTHTVTAVRVYRNAVKAK